MRSLSQKETDKAQWIPSERLRVGEAEELCPKNK